MVVGASRHHGRSGASRSHSWSTRRTSTKPKPGSGELSYAKSKYAEFRMFAWNETDVHLIWTIPRDELVLVWIEENA